MKLKLIFMTLALVLAAKAGMAAEDKDAGLRLIATRGKVLCGTDLGSKTYAFKDEDGEWHGIDVDFCKTFSTAVFGRSDRFEMVNVGVEEVASAFLNNKIDIMLSGANYTATIDVERKYDMAGLLYYDRQLFLAKKLKEASSLEAYKGKRVCVVKGSEDADNILDYSEKFGLNLQPLVLYSQNAAKEAFFLKRCDLLSGNEVYLRGLIKNAFVDKESLFLVPDVIRVKPVYAFVAKGNESLRVVAQWVLNALVLLEEKGINSLNVETIIGENNVSVKNLLGIDKKLWTKFGLEPEWVKVNTKELGNFAEIIERNFGEESELPIVKKENALMEDGGGMRAKPFL